MIYNKKAAFLTLGCKVNQYESDAMKEILIKRGYEIADFKDRADVYIINTCSVTNVADKKSRQMIRRARKQNPEAAVVACGCYVQTERDRNKEKENLIEEADILLGNNRKGDIADVLDKWFAERRVQNDVTDIAVEKEYENLYLTDISDHTRAYLKIQDGCNQFCSYCIIPYARGRIRSRDPEDVKREVNILVKKGFREIVLTGIHLSSYGLDRGDTSLLDLIRELNDIERLERIRLGSLEPRIITENFVRELSRCEKVCPHFHLSLQSGCDATLKRMNRHYTTAEYEDAVNLLRTWFDRPAITTDVIVGFAGETEEEFETTRKFLEKIRLYDMHIFKYSVREGTRAQSMEGQLPGLVKIWRSSQLMELAATLKKEYEESMIGTVDQVLLEDQIEIDGVRYMQGYTPRYVKVAVELKDNSSYLRQNERITVNICGFINEELLKGKVMIDFDQVS